MVKKSSQTLCRDIASQHFFLFSIWHTSSRETLVTDHKDINIWSALDWLVDKDLHKVTIDPDNITFIPSHISQTRKSAKGSSWDARNWKPNRKSKQARRICDSWLYETTWKKCKCLGSMIDTENDIKRKKGLTYDAMKKLGKLFRSHHLTVPSKCRIFEAYISSVMLYNRVNNFGS